MVDLRAQLNRLADGAPLRSPNVRALAKFAANTSCNVANLAFAARVDLDRVLEGTSLQVPFGQSPFAFRRGNAFEDRLRVDGYKPILGLLAEQMHYEVDGARVENLRMKPPYSRAKMEQRARRTRELIEKVVKGRADAPNLIDGAVLRRDIGGVPAYFEADAVAAHFDQPIHAGEAKSFPTVDGQADPEKLGAAVAQVSIYLLLLRDLVTELGGRADLVSDEALIITPRNAGLQPTLTTKRVGREIDRADRILRATPEAVELAADLSPDLAGFGPVSDKSADESERVEAAHALVEAVGNAYTPSCLSSCGLSRLCRQRAADGGDPARYGAPLVRLLPGVASLDRVCELAEGARPSLGEAPVAAELLRARELLKKYGGEKEQAETGDRRSARSRRGMG
jgi:hypothetical protein